VLRNKPTTIAMGNVRE